VGTYNAGTDYHLRNSVILDNGTNIHVINDRLRFVNEFRLSNNFVYTRTGLDPIEGIGTAAITI